MKVGIVLGTRPEIIKLAPVIFELERQNVSYFVIHTGQHYSENMDRIFWDDLLIPHPKYLLGIREPNHARQTAEMLRQIDEILEKETPDWVLVQGDTNSTMAGALAAAKRKGIKLAHLEAGLRSFDREMPEEINRIIVDHISDLLLVPTEESMMYLAAEGIPRDRCLNVGNTIEDMLIRNLPKALSKSQILQQMELMPRQYLLLTIHRQENTDEPTRLKNILETIFQTSHHFNLKVVFPIHPRTRIIIDQMSLEIPSHVYLIDPIGYYEFLILQKEAKLVATDSGGVQEETCILETPCVTLRDNTERPETVRLGSNILAGVEPTSIRASIEKQLCYYDGGLQWVSPYGQGAAASRVVAALMSK